jgi:ligand-binding sensor domain-containing protein
MVDVNDSVFGTRGCGLNRIRSTCVILLAIVWVGWCRLAFSETVPVWSIFNSENSELPRGPVVALTPSADGGIWVGTSAGLARLGKDGRWQTYTKATKAPTHDGLPVNSVLALALGADGALWIGTDGGGLARLDADGQHWRTYTKAGTDDQLPANKVTALATDADGALWIGTGSGSLARLDKDGHWRTYTRAEAFAGLHGNEVTALLPRPDGTLWVGTIFGGGLAQLDKDGHWQTYTPTNTKGGLRSTQVSALAPGADGALWVGAFSGDVARLDRKGGWDAYTQISTNGELPGNDVAALASCVDGSLWVGTSAGGLARLDTAGHWRNYTRGRNIAALPTVRIRALALGTDGAVWIGTELGGLVRLDVDGPWETYTEANTNGGLPVDGVTALAYDPNGGLWVGMEHTGHLARLDKNGHWNNYEPINETRGEAPPDRVTTLGLAGDNSLWAGAVWTGDGILVHADKDGQHLRTYTEYNTSGVLQGNEVTALARGAHDALWVGTDGGGLARLDKNGHWQNYTYASTYGGLPSNRLTAMAPGPGGSLWVGTAFERGVVRVDDDRKLWTKYTPASTSGGLPDYDVSALTVGADGTLWVGTDGGGLARLNEHGNWYTFTTANTDSGLPVDRVTALAPSPDGALWVGTDGGGLARLDKDGHWQIYTQDNTQGGLPGDNVRALLIGANGDLWVGTNGGIGHLRSPPAPTHQIVEVIGDIHSVTQPKHTVAVIAFDHSQLTQPGMFHYVWRLTERGWLGDVEAAPEALTKAPVYTALFRDDGSYRLSVFAIDRYGMWSKPKLVDFSIALPKSDPLRGKLVLIAEWLAKTGILYFLLIYPIILLYPHFSWARTATNSGVFTKFPFLHKSVLSSRWARRHIFHQYTTKAVAASAEPKHYFPQSLFAEKDRTGLALTPDGSIQSLAGLFASQRRALLIARSGTGKSVFLRHLMQEVGARFLKGERVPLPVLIDLRIHVLAGRTVQDLIFDALRGGGVELSDSDLSFLVGKGGLLVLVDSLNELPNPADAQLFHIFFNRDAHNFTLVASQSDLIKRDDVNIFNLAEVTAAQATRFLKDATGMDVYSTLPPEAQTLARNPQDLVLLAEVVERLSGAQVPTHRAKLYSAILNEDGSLRSWVARNDSRLLTIYALAFRMIAEQRVLGDSQLREWIAAEPNVSGDGVETIVNAIRASRLFRDELQRDILGRDQPLTGFRHELIGKFLAARHIRRLITEDSKPSAVDYIALTADELWLDAFFFVIDEINSTSVLNNFLVAILAAGGTVRARIAAYAIRTKTSEQPNSEVRLAYVKVKLDEDMALTPVA